MQRKPTEKELAAARRQLKAAMRAMDRLPFGDAEAERRAFEKYDAAMSVLNAAHG